MKYIIIIAILLVAYVFIKSSGGKNSSHDGQTDYKAQNEARLAFHIPSNIPVNWASHHSGIGYVGDAAIVNCDYITAVDWTRNYTWKISLEDISRYSIERNNDNKWVHIHIYVKDGSKEVLVLHEKEVSSFEKAYKEAVDTFYEMKELMEQEEQ